MIKKFSVENFKNFKSRITVDLSVVGDYRFNPYALKNHLINKGIIYGKNSVGKSNLGFAIMELRHYLFPESRFHLEAYKAYLNYDSDAEYATFDYEFEIAGDIILYSYKKTNFKNFIYEKLVVNGKELFEYEADGEKEGLKFEKEGIFSSVNQDFFTEGKSFLKYLVFTISAPEGHWLNNFANYIKNMRHLCHSEERFISPFEDVLGIDEQIIESENVENLVTFLRDCDVEIPDLIVKEDVENNKRIYFDFKRKLLFTPNISVGTRTLVNIFLLGIRKEEISFLFIDEFDASFHFTAADAVLRRMLHEEDIQILLTTHNTDVLSNKYLRPDSYFVLSNTNFKNLSQLTKRELREGNNLEKLFQAGEFSYE